MLPNHADKYTPNGVQLITRVHFAAETARHDAPVEAAILLGSVCCASGLPACPGRAARGSRRMDDLQHQLIRTRHRQPLLPIPGTAETAGRNGGSRGAAADKSVYFVGEYSERVLHRGVAANANPRGCPAATRGGRVLWGPACRAVRRCVAWASRRRQGQGPRSASPPPTPLRSPERPPPSPFSPAGGAAPRGSENGLPLAGGRVVRCPGTVPANPLPPSPRARRSCTLKRRAKAAKARTHSRATLRTHALLPGASFSHRRCSLALRDCVRGPCLSKARPVRANALFRRPATVADTGWKMR